MTSLEPVADLAIGAFDDTRYAKLAQSRAAQYQSAEGFPHIVLDSFLDEPLARSLLQAFPTSDSEVPWTIRDNTNNRRRFLEDERFMPLPIRLMLREFNSRQFLLFLETLTGIDNLLPDPYFVGGGIHISGPGDFLNIHADFNWHHKLHAHRRVNALLYLSPDWKEEWNGALEMWSPDMSRQVETIYPGFNRLVVFNVTDVSNHGQPKANACPPGVYRQVLNLYYYTAKRDESEISAPHFTAYKTENSPSAVALREGYLKSVQISS
ncbi:MAG TPA: 2OG-Fe(II) oxygenase [Bryobacteraceae bacterium]|nr:2OG-Fe(II) oxygenase [Bryobacteraceae bacterium]